MTDDDVRRAMNATVRDQKAGSVAQTVGWTLVLFGFITGVWVLIGFREGSYFWLWYTLALAVIGAFLIGWGSMRRSRGSRDFAARAGAVESPAVSSLSTADEREREREEKGGPRAA